MTVVAILPWLFCCKQTWLARSVHVEKANRPWKEQGIFCEGRWPRGSHSLQWFFYLVDETGSAVSPSIANSWNLLQAETLIQHN